MNSLDEANDEYGTAAGSLSNMEKRSAFKNNNKFQMHSLIGKMATHG